MENKQATTALQMIVDVANRNYGSNASALNEARTIAETALRVVGVPTETEEELEKALHAIELLVSHMMRVELAQDMDYAERMRKNEAIGAVQEVLSNERRIALVAALPDPVST